MAYDTTDDCSGQGSVTPESSPAKPALPDSYLFPPLEQEALSYFAVEADHHLRTLQRGLMQWREEPVNRAVIDVLFRAAHTLKGSAYTIGFRAIGDLMHRLEDLLEQVRIGRRDATPELARVFLEVVDVVSLLIDQRGDAVEEIRRQFHTVMSALHRIIEGGEAKSLAETDTVRGRGEPEKRMIIPRSGVTEPPMKILEVAEGAGTIRVTVSRLDRLMNLADQLVVARGRLDQRIRRLEGLGKPTLPGRETTSLLSNGGRDSCPWSVTCFSPGMWRGLLESVREQADELQRLIEALIGETAQARLAPIDSAFSMVPQVASDTARRLAKTVSLKFSVDQVEADPLVIRRWGGLVEHLVRNAVYHGIELPQERRAKGKPEAGLITVRAALEGRLLVIEVEDDGRGVNLDAVRHKAVAMGLSRPELIASVSDSQVLQWIFIPGLSTASEVGDLAGRGVGLDAVKATVEEMGGQIEVASWLDRGTNVTVRLPLRLLRARFQLMRVGSSLYAVARSRVRALLTAPQTLSVQEDGRMFLTWNHTTVEVRSIEQVSHGRTGEVSSSSPIVVVQVSGSLRGVMVDERLGVQDLTVRAWDSLAPLEQSCCVGTALNQEGQVVLILDPNRLEMASPTREG
ncbi:MAG: Hpt domain-containing protein [Nitrospira sp.]|nr:Hpt domain-containing protein [Nitrospira sp.]